MNTEMKIQLKQLAEKIKEKELYLYDVSIHAEENRLLKKSIELNVKREVMGNKKLKNDSQRTETIGDMLYKHEYYQQLIKTEKAIKETKAKEQIELDFLKRTFRAIEVIAWSEK